MKPDGEDGQPQDTPGGQAVLEAKEEAPAAAPGRRSQEEADGSGRPIPTAAAGLGGAPSASENRSPSS